MGADEWITAYIIGFYVGVLITDIIFYQFIKRSK